MCVKVEEAGHAQYYIFFLLFLVSPIILWWSSSKNVYFNYYIFLRHKIVEREKALCPHGCEV
jgi:hypothetical protein